MDVQLKRGILDVCVLAAIRSVDASAVTRILGLLADGAQVEYLIL